MTRKEAIDEVARVLWLSSAATRKDKVRIIDEVCDGRPWLGVDRWNWTRFVRDVLKAEKTYEVL